VLGVAEDAVDLAWVEEAGAVVAAYVDRWWLPGFLAGGDPGEVGEAGAKGGLGGGAEPVDGVVEGLEGFGEEGVGEAVGAVVGELGDAGAGVDEGAASGAVADDLGVLGGQGWAAGGGEELEEGLDGGAVAAGGEGGVEGDGVGWGAFSGGEGVPGFPEVLVDGPPEVAGVDELVEGGAEFGVVDEGGEEGAFGFAVGDDGSAATRPGLGVVVGVEGWLCRLGHARLSHASWVGSGWGAGAGEEAVCK
jgi:hypothetical protein